MERPVKGSPRRVVRSPFDDPTPLFADSSGVMVPAGKVARLFHDRRDDPSRMENLAFGSLKKIPSEHRFDLAPLVLSWIPQEHAEVREKVAAWCEREGLPTQPGQPRPVRHHGVFTRFEQIFPDDERWIRLLAATGDTALQAEVLTLQRYQGADPDTFNTIYGGIYKRLEERNNYLGPRRSFQTETHLPTPLPLPALPRELFTHKLVAPLVWERERRALVPIYQEDPAKLFRYLDQLKQAVNDPAKQEFIAQFEQYFANVEAQQFPGIRSMIFGNQKSLPEHERTARFPFPGRWQREYAYRFSNKVTFGESLPLDVCLWDPRTGKSKAALLAIWNQGAKCPLIVCPPSTRDAWVAEIEEMFEDLVQPLKIVNASQMRQALASDITPTHIIVGYPLLSNLGVTDESRQLLKEFIDRFGIDSAIADEAHLTNNPKADCTKVLQVISEMLPKEAPRIAMTATWVINRTGDPDSVMRFLLPERYPHPGDFAREARNNPMLIAALLRSGQILTRMTADEALGDQLPAISEREQPVVLSYFHERVMQAIYEDNTFEGSAKRRVLRQAALDPRLVRQYYHPGKINQAIGALERKLAIEEDGRRQEVIQARIGALQERLTAVSQLCSSDQAQQELLAAYHKFQEWKEKMNYQGPFDEDFLIQAGFEKMTLWAFFNLAGGVHDVVTASTHTEINEAWQGKEILSSIYAELMNRLKRHQLQGNTKVFVYSGFFQDEVTTERDEIDDENVAFDSLYDMARTLFGRRHVAKIDGSVAIEPRAGELADRERVRRRIQSDPNLWLTFLTARAARLGMDLTVIDIEANKRFDSVEVYFLDPPETYEEYYQASRRSRGVGQRIPINVTSFKIAHRQEPDRPWGIHDVIGQEVRFKQLIAKLETDGVPLTDEEQSLVREHMHQLRVASFYPTTPKRELNRFFRIVRGQGYDRNREILQERRPDGLSHEEFFISEYPRNDQNSKAGNNARVVSEVIRQLQRIHPDFLKIADIGSGAGILQQTLGVPLFHFDMLHRLLRFSRSRNGETGNYYAANAAQLPIKAGAVDMSVASFLLNWSSNRLTYKYDQRLELSERTMILKEIARATRIGGTVILTIPDDHLSMARFGTWLHALDKYYQLRPVEGIPSGLIRATDLRPEDISWLFVLQKVGEVDFRPLYNEPVSLRNLLMFDFDDVSATIEPSEGDRRSSVQTISVVPDLPHREFEVQQPDGSLQKIHYSTAKSEAAEVRRKVVKDELDILARSRDEFSWYKDLISVVQVRWNLTEQDAKEVALRMFARLDQRQEVRDQLQRTFEGLDSLFDEIKKEMDKEDGK